jgi:hypothetical protein
LLPKNHKQSRKEMQVSSKAALTLEAFEDTHHHSLLATTFI